MQLALLIAVVLVGLLAAFTLLIAYNLVMQNGRILLRLERLESVFVAPPDPAALVEDYIPNLPPGTPAPPFELPDLNGIPRRLTEWRGQRVLLVFFDPECAFSRRLLPLLVGLTRDVVPGRPAPVIVSTGAIEANRRLFDASDFSGAVLLQRATEVAAAYRVDGTPMSYLLDADGTTVGEVAVGVQAIMLQAGEIGSVEDAVLDDGGASPALLDAPVTRRDGLTPGEAAPLFRLPSAAGGELSLLDFRGRATVIAFLDPECEACDQVTSLLESVHREHPQLGVLAISRGDPQLTRIDIARHDATFAVGLQRHWEVSRRYGIFATPAAFLLDEWGVVSAEVAVGAASINQLLVSAGRAADQMEIARAQPSGDLERDDL